MTNNAMTPSGLAPFGLTWSALALIGANLIPLIGVIFYDWDSRLVLALFWIENLIIGVFNLAKMIAVVIRNKKFGDLFMCGFFIFHYGFFCVGHGLLLWEILDLGPLDSSEAFSGFSSGLLGIFAEGATVLLSFIEMYGKVILIGIGALVLSHLVSFIENFLLKGEIFRETANGLMGKPYSRIVIMHVGLILGALALEKLGSPIWLLVIIVLFKIIVDLSQHLKRRKKALHDERVKDL